METGVQQPSAGLRILLVDPHEQVRSSLARRLLMDQRVTSVSDTSSAEEAAAIIRATAPDVVLVDPGRGSGDWRASLRSLVDLRDGSRSFLIVMYVARDDQFSATEAVQLGADLYLLKGLRTADLMAAVSEQFHLAASG
jgi:DNA-binding NarL/FixJ family response regulator